MERGTFRAILLLGGVLSGASVPATAQTVLDLPRASQQASVSQRIGLTRIAISYCRPLANNRKIWGGLVPYGQVWRAGANENTTFDVSDDVSIEGKPLPKGIYGLHMIPGEGEWTIIFSKVATSWGAFTYDEKEDALRVAVKPASSDPHEALTYDFDDVRPDSAVVTLRWEKVAVPFKVGVDVDSIVAESLRRQLRAWSRWNYNGWDEGANYLLDHHGNLQDALSYADHSIQVEERFDNTMTRANVLKALGRDADSAAAREKAFAMGSAQQIHNYGRGLQLEGHQEEAFQVFRLNIKKYPDSWLARSEAARLACSKGDFAAAVKEMKVAAAGAPADYKPAFERLVKRLEAKEDINK
jgi:tetratricopeptide (TPR) repeat protein